MNITSKIQLLESLDHTFNVVSDRYETAWQAHYERPTAETKEELEIAGLLVESASSAWMEALAS